MEKAPCIEKETPDEPIKKSFEIKQGNEKYKLNIELSDDTIKFTIVEDDIFFEKFEKTYNLKEIKSLDKLFSNYLSCQEFFIYIKDSIKNKNIIIKEIKDNQISIRFKENSVSFDLIKKEVNCDLKDQNNSNQMTKLITTIIKENKNIKQEINVIKEENKKLSEDNQNIIKENNKLILLLNESLKKAHKNFIKELNELKKQNQKLTKEIEQIKENNEIKNIKVDEIIKNIELCVKKLTEENKNLKNEKNNCNNNSGKRRNYNVPKLRVKKTNENETRKEEDTTYNEDIRKNEKEKNVQKLIENISYIKNFQKMMEKEKQTKENKDNENKRKFIEDSGYDLLSDEENKEENDNDEEIKCNKEEEKNEELKENNNINNNITNAVCNNSITNNNSSDIINHSNFISNNNVNMNLSGSSDKNINNNETMNNKKKEKMKLNVNTLKYCNLISNYINIPELKQDNYNLNININDSFGDFSRESFSDSLKKEIKPKKGKKLNINENKTSEIKFNYNTKKNIRSEREIKKYMEKKKKELKLEQEKKNKKAQEKKIKKFLNLNKLDEDIMSSMNKNMSKIKNEEENKEFNDKNPNEYFVGKNIKRKNSNISHTTESSQSIVLDQNNYYLDLIMSKNILSNNIINNNLFNYNKKEINTHNDQIITTKDKNIKNINYINANNSNIKLSQEIIKNNNINKKDIYGELQLKIKETHDKDNILFSKTNMKYLIQQNRENNFQGKKNNISEINNNNIIIISDKKENKREDKKENIIINSKNNVNAFNNKNEKKEIENTNEINKKEDDSIDININDNEKNKFEEEQIIIKKEIEDNKEKAIDKENQEIIPTKKTYEFSQLVLENYYKIFISLEDYLNSLTKKNAVNNIITFGESRFSYKIGLENLIILIKSFPFNILRMIYQRQYYKEVLRQFFIPFIRRAFNNINLYSFYLFKFSEINKAIEKIYQIIFFKKIKFLCSSKGNN